MTSLNLAEHAIGQTPLLAFPAERLANFLKKDPSDLFIQYAQQYPEATSQWPKLKFKATCPSLLLTEGHFLMRKHFPNGLYVEVPTEALSCLSKPDEGENKTEPVRRSATSEQRFRALFTPAPSHETLLEIISADNDEALFIEIISRNPMELYEIGSDLSLRMKTTNANLSLIEQLVAFFGKQNAKYFLQPNTSYNLLHSAILFQQLGGVSLFSQLIHPADPCLPQELSAFHFAIYHITFEFDQNETIFRELLAHKPQELDFNTLVDRTGNTPLHTLAQTGCQRKNRPLIFDLFVAEGSHWETRNLHGFTVLDKAIQYKNLLIIQTIFNSSSFKMDASTFVNPETQENIFHLAAKEGEQQNWDYLVEKMQETDLGKTILKQLLQQKDKKQTTPIDLAKWNLVNTSAAETFLRNSHEDPLVDESIS